MRVLIVARWYPAHDDPGRGSFVADLVTALRAHGHEVRVASWEFAHYGADGRDEALSAARRAWGGAVSRLDALNQPSSWGAGVPVARLPALYTVGESVAEATAGHAATLVPFGIALRARWPFDVIHAHTALPDGAAAVELGSRVGTPVLVTEHDRSLRKRLPESPETRDAYRAVIDGAGRVVAVSRQFRDLITRALGVDREAIGVLYNPIRSEFFERPVDRARDPSELLYVGARKEDKGIVTLLEAFAEAHGARPMLRLRLVGRSPSAGEEDRWRAMAEELGIGDAVRFDPPGDRVEVAGAMARASVFVHPSPFESFGMVAAEALASGLPVAATGSGVEEIVGTDGRFGEIADGIDAAALSAAILRVVDRRDRFDPDELRAAAERFQAKRVAADTVALYEELIEERDSGARPHRVRTTAVAAAGAAEPHASGAERSDAADAPDAAEPDARTSFGRVLAVGQNATLAERRLSTLPDELLSRIVLVTRRPGDRLRALLPDRVIDIDPGPAYAELLASRGAPAGTRWNPAQRLAAFLRAPAAALERRRLRQDRPRVLRELVATGVARRWDAMTEEDPTQPILLAMDVDDVGAAAVVLERGVTTAPGHTRWLADRWDEWHAGRPSDGEGSR